MSLKRRSTEKLNTNDTKHFAKDAKTSGHYFDDSGSEYFHTQFINKFSEDEKNATSGSSKSDKHEGTHDLHLTQYIGFTQTLSESQFEDTIPPGQKCTWTQVAPMPNEHRINESFSQQQNKLNASKAVFNDDEEIEAESYGHHSSQIFLDDVSKLNTNIGFNANISLNNSISLNLSQLNSSKFDGFDVFKSDKTLTEYLQLHRSMRDENQHNVNECDLSQLLNVCYQTQFQQEVESAFTECEKTIRNLDENSEEKVDTVLENFVSDETILKELAEVQELKDFADTGFIPPPKEFSSNNNFKKPIAIIQQPRMPVSTSTFCTLGPFFGLPRKVQSLIKEYKGIDELYDWQKECLQLPAVTMKRNLIYALPTSGGKTLVSEILILREILCRRKNCLFILPFVSIVQEKVYALSPFAVQLEFLIEEYAAGKGCLPPRKRRKKRSVYIATIEKGLALFDSLIETDRANEIGLIIVDELHMVGEPGRGATLEALLTKIKYIKAGIQIVGMSATIGNLNELAKFLDADVYYKDFRPVELREHIKCGSDILEIRSDAYDVESAFNHVRTVDFSVSVIKMSSEDHLVYSDEVQKMDPDHVAGLVSEVIPKSSCLIFCPSKKNCENLATLLCQILSKKYVNNKTSEKQELIKAIESDTASPLCPVLSKTIPYGIAYHHSGLTADERRHLEDAFRQNILCVICCTSTLAAGVNLPAKRVIIRSPYVGREFITLSKYKQMVGRAGRAGFGESGDSILICAARDNIRVCSLLCSPMDEVASQMSIDNGRALRALLLSTIGLGLATCRSELCQFATSTLLHQQAERLDVNVPQMTEEIIRRLLETKALTTKSEPNKQEKNKSLEIEILSQDSSFESNQSTKPKRVLSVKPSTILEVSRMGKACFKSNIDLDRAKTLFNDLLQAQRSLVLLDYFHLLYLVTPYDGSEMQIQPDSRIYYTKYNNLLPDQLHTAKIIGITESVAMKLISGKPYKPELERTVNKFFFTLMLYDLWQFKSVSDIATSFQVNRGLVQSLMGSAAINASCILKFCEEFEEFWAYVDLLKSLTQRLSYCCTSELLPLMELPCVKLGRAKQLYLAGYKTLEDVAKASSKELVEQIEHMNHRVARQLISSAKVLLLEKVETLRDQAQDCLDILTDKKS